MARDNSFTYGQHLKYCWEYGRQIHK